MNNVTNIITPNIIIMNVNVNANIFDINPDMFKNALPLTIDPFYSNSYNDTRRMKVIIMSDILNKNVEFRKLKYHDQIDMLAKIEISCEDEAIRKTREQNLRCEWSNPRFNDIYHIVCYNVISLLSDDDDSIIFKLINKEIDVGTIARLTYKDLSCSKVSTIMNKINKRANIEQTIKYTEMYFCQKCKNNKTTVERVQNRSGDEGSSFFITCLFCGAKWSK
jgi:DNA-directed RNA polymerase subunit M/transcription elongation factor TFIIS